MSAPAVGSVYLDPKYGTPIVRLTNCRATANAADSGTLGWTTPEYSSVCPWNLGGSLLLIVHQSYFGLYSGDGVFIRNLPFAVSAGSEPRWSRKDIDKLYFISGNRLEACMASTGAIAPVHFFGEYQTISGKGEGDISQDHDRLVLIGDDREAFIYDAITDQRSAPLATGGRPIDSLYVSPDGTMFTVTWNDGAGTELYDWNGRLVRKLGQSGSHMDICRDPRTGRQWLVRFNANDDPPLSGCLNGVEKVALDNGERVCLLQLGWANSVQPNILAVHISCNDAGTVLVETYNASGNSDLPYSNELVLVNLDGSGVRSICQHHSRVDNYESMPLASIARGGSKLIFGSDMGQHPEDPSYKDVYLVTLSSAVPTPPAPPPGPVAPPPPIGSPPSPTGDANALVARLRALRPPNTKLTVGEWNDLFRPLIPGRELPTARELGFGDGQRPKFDSWLRAMRERRIAEMYGL